MLKDAGINRVKLMTNNPLKIRGLIDNGIEIVERLKHMSGVSTENKDYLKTKRNRMGSYLGFVILCNQTNKI